MIKPRRVNFKFKNFKFQSVTARMISQESIQNLKSKI